MTSQHSGSRHSRVEVLNLIDALCDRFEQDCQAGLQPSIEDYLLQVAPDVREELRSELLKLQIDCDQVVKTNDSGDADSLPSHIDRYRVLRELGRGGFGKVYLAEDPTLQRNVAIKVPSARNMDERAIDQFLSEARLIARMQHTGIVPVYDVGRFESGSCFIVYKWIDGTNLAEHMRSSTTAIDRAVKLVEEIAQTLQYAHQHGVVHRDIKPSNILLDAKGQVYVTDFGMALRDSDWSGKRIVAGTPAYMSPEQLRGESHRIDGRSDVFSLGVVLYELLTGRRPYRGDSFQELREQVLQGDVRPLRQHRANIPRNLEHICLKAIARRAADRFGTAIDFAEALHEFLAQYVPEVLPLSSKTLATTSSTVSLPSHQSHRPFSDAPAAPIIPRGLRSYSDIDAAFFLELLAGPRTRDGLPESIDFWKRRIESYESQKTFAVGVLYGPSGCGKTSLLQAGILPRLNEHVTTIWLNATPKDTEKQLKSLLRARFPQLSSADGLPEMFHALRRSYCGTGPTKILIVLDQFEQWLFQNTVQPTDPLVAALRQCDGVRLTCLLSVRDDFWMEVTRFVQELEISLTPGQNVAAVDLFDRRHAARVLTAWGRAYGSLPTEGDLSPTELEFIDKSIKAIAESDRIISVRLAVFAEMVKSRQWTPETLQRLGGVEGVGVLFLEESLSSRAAVPQHRFHEAAARAVLKRLLPYAGSEIKGHSLSYDELLQASGYGQDRHRFDDLLRILDADLRLLTPIRSAKATDAGRNEEVVSYQLTHDFLVPTLREWLNQKERESARGRAKLLLEERSREWSVNKETRHLPSLTEYLGLMSLTNSNERLPLERAYMKASARRHGARMAYWGVALFNLGLVFVMSLSYLRAKALAETIQTAETVNVPALAKQIWSNSWWARYHLQAGLDQVPNGSRQARNIVLAILPRDVTLAKRGLMMALKSSPGEELYAFREALSPHHGLLLDDLWTMLEKSEHADDVLGIAAMLAHFDPNNQRWSDVAEYVTERLISTTPANVRDWIESLHDARHHLKAHLVQPQFRERELARRNAALAIATFFRDDVPLLMKTLIEDVRDAQQYAPLLAAIRDYREQVVPVLFEEIAGLPDATKYTEQSRKELFRKRSNAAVALVDLGETSHLERIWLRRDDPTEGAYLTHRLAELGAAPQSLVNMILARPVPLVRRSLYLALGEFEPMTLPAEDRLAVREEARKSFVNDSDPGVHSAAQWFLRRWNSAAATQPDIPKSWNPDELVNRTWYINPFNQTMVRIPGGTYTIGHGTTSRPTVQETFYVSTTEVSNGDYLRAGIDRNNWLIDMRKQDDQHPATQLTIYNAMQFCNLLSQAEGLAADQWCYAPNDDGAYANGMSLVEDFQQRVGYRLPLDDEWEVMCRAYSVTSWSFGEALELARHYAWCVENARTGPQPLGLLKPNAFGIFDSHGNVNEFCMPRQRTIHDKLQVPTRSGAFYKAHGSVRSVMREERLATRSDIDTSFRVLRKLR